MRIIEFFQSLWRKLSKEQKFGIVLLKSLLFFSQSFLRGSLVFGTLFEDFLACVAPAAGQKISKSVPKNQRTPQKICERKKQIFVKRIFTNFCFWKGLRHKLCKEMYVLDFWAPFWLWRIWQNHTFLFFSFFSWIK